MHSISKKRWILLFVFATGLVCNSARADFDILSRFSEVSVDTTNLGGVTQSVSTTSTTEPFQIQLIDSVEHIEPGGNINGGIWDLNQDSTLSANLIRASLQTEAITLQLFGDGIGVLNLSNVFETEFEVTETTELELSGSFFGTHDTIFAHNFVRIRLEAFNGVAYITQVVTSASETLDVPFQFTAQPGTMYRLSVESNANAMGEGASASGATVCLRPTATAGDVNLDGVVNLLDVDPFIDALATGIYQAEADTNCDGEVSLLDVDSFIGILSGS